MANLISFDQRRPDAALERLNRRTGLDFRDWPESLLEQSSDELHESDAHVRPGPHPGTTGLN
jgi:hypothetical protein